MEKYKGLGITEGKVCTLDDEIAALEGLIDSGRVEAMMALALTNIGGGFFKVYVTTQGTPLDRAREMMRMGIEAVDAMTGPIPARLALEDVMAERQRQMQGEGWTEAHDDAHGHGELALAAAAYAAAGLTEGMEVDGGDVDRALWPFDETWWKPRTRRENLVRAGALILAEIERLDRAAAPKGNRGGN